MTVALIVAVASIGCALWDSSRYTDNVDRLSDADGDGVSIADGDCNDTNPAVHPGAEDSCDAIDNDCDGDVDETPPDTVWCQDVDGDGFGDIAFQKRTCFPDSGWVANCTDCDDSSSTISPAATESCNGFDDNCDGEVDPSGAVGAIPWYPDRDGDGYGATKAFSTSCTAPAGCVDNNADCDDARDDTYPGATEVCNDGHVNDCGANGESCGWNGSEALDTTLAAFIAGPDMSGEGLGVSLGFLDTNQDGVDDLVFSGFGDMYGDGTAGALHIWYGAPSGERTVQDAHAHLVGTTDLYLGLSDSAAPALRLVDAETSEGIILVASAGWSSEFDESGVTLNAGSAIYGTTTVTPDAVFARGASAREGFGCTIASSDSLLEAGRSVVTGAPYNSERATYGGIVYINLPSAPNAADAVASVRGDERELLGTRVAADVDMTGDGVSDLVLGTGYDVASRIYIFDGPLIGSLTTGEAAQAVRDDRWYTDTTTVIPDVDGDGLPDIAVGTTESVAILAGSDHGATGVPELVMELIDDEPSATGNGYSFAVGDINADGTMDLVVAAPFLDTPSAFGNVIGGGALAVVPLGGGYSGQVNLWEAATSIFYGPEPRSGLGTDLALGDVNADGFTDMMVSTPYWSSNGYPSAGGVWFILGGGI